MRGNAEQAPAQSDDNSPSESQDNERPQIVERRVTMLPAFNASQPSGRVVGGNSSTNDGVFANLAAKPERGEKTEDQPPVCLSRGLHI